MATDDLSPAGKFFFSIFSMSIFSTILSIAIYSIISTLFSNQFSAGLTIGLVSAWFAHSAAPPIKSRFIKAYFPNNGLHCKNCGRELPKWNNEKKCDTCFFQLIE